MSVNTSITMEHDSEFPEPLKKLKLSCAISHSLNSDFVHQVNLVLFKTPFENYAISLQLMLEQISSQSVILHQIEDSIGSISFDELMPPFIEVDFSETHFDRDVYLSIVKFFKDGPASIDDTYLKPKFPVASGFLNEVHPSIKLMKAADFLGIEGLTTFLWKHWDYLLLKYVCDVDDETLMTPLRIFIYNFHLGTLPEDVDDHEPLLVKAARLGHAKIVAFLLEIPSIDPNCYDDEGYTPIYWACRFQHLDVIRLLYSHEGCIIYHCGPEGRSALEMICMRGFVDLLTEFCVIGSTLDHVLNVNGETLIHIACRSNKIDILDVLLSKTNICPNFTCLRYGRTALHYAATGKIEVLERLLEDDRIDVNADDMHFSSALHLACASIDVHYDNARLLLEHENIDVEAQNSKNLRPLHIACDSASVKIAKMLVDRGVNLGAVCASGTSPLMYACLGGSLEIVKLLISKGVLEYERVDVFDVMKCAVKSNQIPIFEYLIQFCSNDVLLSTMVLICKSKSTPLELLYRILQLVDVRQLNLGQFQQCMRCPRYLLSRPEKLSVLLNTSKIEWNMQDIYYTFSVCISYSLLDALIIFIKRFPELPTTPIPGQSQITTLILACTLSTTCIVEYLIEECPNITISELTRVTEDELLQMSHIFPNFPLSEMFSGHKIHLSPLIVACRLGKIQLVKYLLSKGASPTLGNPICAAIKSGCIETTKLLLGYSENLMCEHLNDKMQTAFHIAVQQDQPEILQLFLDRKPDGLFICDNEKWSPAQLAAAEGSVDCLKILISTIQEYYSYCLTEALEGILKCACSKGVSKVVEYVIGLCSCSLNTIRFECGWGLLHILASEGYLDCLKLVCECENTFMDERINLDQLTNSGETPLSLACFRGHYVIVEYLFDMGASISKCNVWGASPLHIAALGGNVPTIRLLLECICDKTLKAFDGRTPYDVALGAAYRDETVLDLLQIESESE